MSRSAYCKVECRVCGRRISTAGFADYNHKMKHVREGKMRIVPFGVSEPETALRISLCEGYRFEVVR